MVAFIISFLFVVLAPKVEVMTFEPTIIVARCSPLCVSRKAQRVYKNVVNLNFRPQIQRPGF